MWVRAIPPPTGRGHAALPQSAAWPAVPAARPFCFAAPHFRPPHWFRLWCIPTSGSWTLTCPSRSRPLTARHACGRNRMQFAVRQLQVQAQPLHARLAHQSLQLARLHGALLPQALPDSCTNLCHRRLGHLRNRFSLLRPRWAKVHTPAAEREGAAEALRGWHMGPAGWTAGAARWRKRGTRSFIPFAPTTARLLVKSRHVALLLIVGFELRIFAEPQSRTTPSPRASRGERPFRRPLRRLRWLRLGL